MKDVFLIRNVKITLFAYIHEVTTAQCEIKYNSIMIMIIRYKSTEMVATSTWGKVTRSLILDMQTTTPPKCR